MTSQEARQLLSNSNIRAFLRMIRLGEGTSGEDGYRTLFGGELIDDLSTHPRRVISKNGYTSTAAGAYQFLSRTWNDCQAGLNLPDFSPNSQDLAAVFLLDRANATEAIIRGDFDTAVAKCAPTWASLPGSPYGQPTVTLEEARREYEKWGGQYLEIREIPQLVETVKEPRMPIPALVAALGPLLIESIGKLAKYFKTSQVSERNVAVVSAALDIATKATGAVNAQQAIDKIREDPAAKAAVEKAIEDNWYALTEAGGGGIDGARKAEATAMASEMPWWSFVKSPSFWAMMLLTPLVYLIVLSMIGILGPVQWSDDVRSQTAGFLTGTIVGGLMGYYFGQVTSRNRPAQ